MAQELHLLWFHWLRTTELQELSHYEICVLHMLLTSAISDKNIVMAESAVCEHAGLNWKVNYLLVSDYTWLAFVKKKKVAAVYVAWVIINKRING
jgi:hypothetical protein